MNSKPVQASDLDTVQPVLSLFELLVMLLAFAGWAFAAVVIVPLWLPGLTASLLGTEPKAYWYLARVSGVIAFLLLWLSVVFGLVVSNKMARLWNGGPTAVELHQFITWLAIALAMFHALILLGDQYIKATLWQVAVPFTYVGYQPAWVALGQIAFYLAVIVAASFYVRKQLGFRAWRTLHYVSFAIYFLLTLHGIFAGTDTNAPGMVVVYLATGISVYSLLLVRVFDAIRNQRPTSHVHTNSILPPNPPRRR